MINTQKLAWSFRQLETHEALRKQIAETTSWIHHSAKQIPGLLRPPTIAQLQFHMDESRLRAIIAANQVGKSFSAAREMWWLIIGKHPYHSIQMHRKAYRFMVCVGNWQSGYTALSRNIYLNAPKHLINWKYSHYDIDRGWGFGGKKMPTIVLNLPNNKGEIEEYVINFVTGRGGSTGGASVDADGVLFDEPPKRNKFDELLARTSSTNGPIIAAFTPYDSEQDLRWMQLYMEGDISEGIPPQSKGWSIHRIIYSHENIPWRTKEEVEEQASLYSSLTYAQRVLAQWGGPIAERVLQAFDEHCYVDEAWKPNMGWWIGSGIDHGEGAGKQFAVLIAWRYAAKLLDEVEILESDEAGNPIKIERKEQQYFEIVIFDEYVNEKPTTSADDAREIERMLARNNIRKDEVDAWIGDVNSAGKESPGMTINQLIGEELGVKIESAYKVAGHLEEFVRILNQKFRLGEVKVHPRCKHTITNFQRWKGLHSPMGKKDPYKHGIDAVHYIVTPLLLPRSKFKEARLP